MKHNDSTELLAYAFIEISGEHGPPDPPKTPNRTFSIEPLYIRWSSKNALAEYLCCLKMAFEAAGQYCHFSRYLQLQVKKKKKRQRPASEPPDEVLRIWSPCALSIGSRLAL